LAGYEIYQPLLREQRRSHGRKITVTPPLFPGYAFVLIVSGWWNARWAAGVRRLVMDGLQPARVPDGVIAEIRSRERGGLIELPKLRLEPGARVRVLQGPLQDQIGLLAACVRTSECSSYCSCWVGSSGSSLHGARSRRFE
jgi:transcriptional antiterminator RfaH